MSREIEHAIFEILSHEARRDILRLVSLEEKGASYTDILTEIHVSTGRLNYHIKQLDGFIEKNTQLRYQLTPLGKRAIDLMKTLDEQDPENLGRYVKITKEPSLMPALKALAYIQMIVILAPITFVSFLLYTELTTTLNLAAIFTYLFILGVAIAIFLWLAYMVKNAIADLDIECLA